MHNIVFHPTSRPFTYDEKINIWESGQNKLINLFQTMIDEIELFSGNNISKIHLDDNKTKINFKTNDKIFIVHGHDEALKYNLANWLRERKLDPIILHEKASMGCNTIINKLERYSDVSCAIILMTSDDLGKEKNEETLSMRAKTKRCF